MTRLAVKMTIKMQGLDRLIADLPGLLDEALGEAAAAATGYAKAGAPVDTGNLKNSIDYKRLAMLKWEMRDGTDYGVYQEYGTSRMRAQPFFRPAVEKVRKQFRTRLRQLIDEAAK